MKRVSDLAIRDSLTGLYLKDYFMRRLRDEVSSSGEAVSLLMIDVDNFKYLNDSYGHTVGDKILVRIADTLKRIVLKEGNIVCRFGGEEFLALLKSDKSGALRIAEIIRKEVQNANVILRDSSVKITVSIGIAVFGEDASSPEDLVFIADNFMYKAKQSGKNAICTS